MSTTRKSVYKRPYKSRQQRREDARSKHGESKDVKFLARVAVGVVLLLALSWGLYVMAGKDSPGPAGPAATEALYSH